MPTKEVACPINESIPVWRRNKHRSTAVALVTFVAERTCKDDMQRDVPEGVYMPGKHCKRRNSM